uniref:X1.A2.3 n=1 Tax=Schmidtea mediterranea TaxID=79327 RepID=V9XMQ0_SCHMD|nr:X1.A2.3 [Schmidtea mediterranea]
MNLVLLFGLILCCTFSALTFAESINRQDNTEFVIRPDNLRSAPLSNSENSLPQTNLNNKHHKTKCQKKKCGKKCRQKRKKRRALCKKLNNCPKKMKGTKEKPCGSKLRKAHKIKIFKQLV